MSISNYAELKILDHTTGKAAWTMPTTVYAKLHTGDPGEAATSSAATETTRKAVSWASAASGAIASSATLEWTTVAATSQLLKCIRTGHSGMPQQQVMLCGLGLCLLLPPLLPVTLFRSPL